MPPAPRVVRPEGRAYTCRVAPRTVAAALCLLAGLAGAPAAAQDLSLTLSGGRATLRADGVTARQILDEWARQGQVRVIGAERLSGEPLTLQLDDVPEADALAIILRQASGYILAPRPDGDSSASVIDRILILPVSVASAAPRGPSPRPAVVLPRPPGPPPVETGFEPPEEQQQEMPGDQGDDAEPQPGDAPPFRPPMPPAGGTPAPPPPPFPMPLPDQAPADTDAPSSPVIVSRPGVLPAPAPSPQQQQEPPAPPPQ